MANQLNNNIPLEVSYLKLIDWMKDQSIISTQWQKQQPYIKEDLKKAINQLPGNMPEIHQLLKDYPDRNFGYYQALDLVYLLRKKIMNSTLSKDSDNIFHSVIKTWELLINEYEKDNLFLADTANTLELNMKETIPSLRDNVNSIESKIQEIEQRMSEIVSRAEFNNKTYKSKCKELNIKGEDVKEELIRVAQQAPTICLKTVELCQNENVQKAINFYKKFIAFTNNDIRKDDIDENLTPYQKRTNHFLGYLQHVIIHGNTTLNFLYNETEPKYFNFNFEKIREKTTGDGDAFFKIDENETTDSILENADTRYLFENDLMELQAFLIQRANELQQNIDTIYSDFNKESEIANEKTAFELQSYLKTVDEVLNTLNNEKNLWILMISRSNKHLNRLLQTFNQLSRIANKYNERLQRMKITRDQLELLMKSTQVQLETWAQLTLKAKNNLENSLKEVYTKSGVTILGNFGVLQ